MLAAYHGHADLVKLLIEHGADPNRVNDRGQSPLAGAVFKKEDAVIDVCMNALPTILVYRLFVYLYDMLTMKQIGSGRRRCRPRLWKTNRHGVCCYVQAGRHMEGQV
jgi:ankyrin repeat protein